MLLAAALLMLQAAPAPACVATDAALPANLAGWTAPATGFGVNQAVTLDAGDVAKLPDVPAGAKPGGAASAAVAIALDQRGWIDVVPGVSGGAALKSTAHGHGPDCSSIRKVVRFDLQPGLYRLYLTGLASASVKVMLVAP